MPLVATCLHAFQIAFGKACSICFPTLRQHMQQSQQALPMVRSYFVRSYFVRNFLLAYQKFNANSTCFVGTQATKDRLGNGRREGGSSLITIHTVADKQVPRKHLCFAEAWLCPLPLDSSTNLLQQVKQQH